MIKFAGRKRLILKFILKNGINWCNLGFPKNVGLQTPKSYLSSFSKSCIQYLLCFHLRDAGTFDIMEGGGEVYKMEILKI